MRLGTASHGLPFFDRAVPADAGGRALLAYWRRTHDTLDADARELSAALLRAHDAFPPRLEAYLDGSETAPPHADAANVPGRWTDPLAVLRPDWTMPEVRKWTGRWHRFWTAQQRRYCALVLQALGVDEDFVDRVDSDVDLPRPTMRRKV